VLRFLDDWFEQVMISIFCSFLVVCLTYTALVRYFVHDQFFTKLSFKAEEIAIFSFVFLLYFGSVLATREGAHFRVSAHLDWIKPPFRRWRFLAGDVATLGFCAFIAWQGLVLVQSAFERPEPSIALGLPMQWIYLVIPLTFALNCFRLVQSYLRPEVEHDHSSSQL
jgi:TRAP-type transport system small permease protein